MLVYEYLNRITERVITQVGNWNPNPLEKSPKAAAESLWRKVDFEEPRLDWSRANLEPDKVKLDPKSSITQIEERYTITVPRSGRSQFMELRTSDGLTMPDLVKASTIRMKFELCSRKKTLLRKRRERNMTP
jgi:hypothetical protein